jgi:6-phosphogluconolactonase
MHFKASRTKIRYCCWVGLFFIAGCGGGYNTSVPSASSAPSPAPTPSPTPSPTPPGASTASLFTMSNVASANTVVAYARNADGTLTQIGSFATGGLGVGHGLENQGALALSDDGKYILVVNPGSNEISALQINAQGLKEVGRAPSGGRLPVSVTSRGSVVYALNRGGEAGDPNGDNISGLRLGTDGSLTPIANSTNPLSSGNTNPAQTELSPDGRMIVVTEHGGDLIDTYTVDTNGVAGGHRVQSSAGLGPFGFAFRNASELFVSEAGGGTASSYSLDAQGVLHTISSAVQTQQATTCWLVITPDGKEAYVTNTVSGSISTFGIGPDGSLSLQASISVKTQGGPLDMAITSDGLYLYVITTSGNIQVFRIDASGGLTQTQTLTGLPAGSNGLVSF